MVENVVQKSLQKLTWMQDREDAERFYKTADVSGIEQGLRVALERIELNARWLARDGSVVREWLLAKRYADR